VDRAREIFANDFGEMVFSALVSERGRAQEKPINIRYPRDFVAGVLRRSITYRPAKTPSFMN
jgi:hypothetical protein